MEQDEAPVTRSRAEIARVRIAHRTDGPPFTLPAYWRAHNKRWLARRCVYCRRVTDGTLHMDHVIPLARGGDHTWENTATTCASCNTSKRNMFLLEWVLSGTAPFGPRQRRRGKPRSPREARMTALRARGKTLQEIATVFGISRQRVSQIVGVRPAANSKSAN